MEGIQEKSKGFLGGKCNNWKNVPKDLLLGFAQIKCSSEECRSLQSSDFLNNLNSFELAFCFMLLFFLIFHRSILDCY